MYVTNRVDPHSGRCAVKQSQSQRCSRLRSALAMAFASKQISSLPPRRLRPWHRIVTVVITCQASTLCDRLRVQIQIQIATLIQVALVLRMMPRKDYAPRRLPSGPVYTYCIRALMHGSGRTLLPPPSTSWYSTSTMTGVATIRRRVSRRAGMAAYQTYELNHCTVKIRMMCSVKISECII